MEVMAVAMFTELCSEAGVMSVSTFTRYLNQHGILCTTFQLNYLFSPHVQSPQFVSYSEFAPFADSLKKVDEYHITAAFPETFGVSTRIEIVDRDAGSLSLEKSRMRRNYAVSRNLSKLPEYFNRLSMN